MNIFVHMYIIYASLVSQMVKNLPVMQKTQIRSLGWEDSLEEEMATYSSILAWRIPWTEEPGSCSPWSHKSQLSVNYSLDNNSGSADFISVFFLVLFFPPALLR